MLDEKYVVFKAEDFDRVYPDMTIEAGNDSLAGLEVEDAVVIRLQDQFAPTALYTYGNTIQSHIEMMDNLFDEMFGKPRSHLHERVRHLEKVRDYFFAKAQESANMKKKLPD